MHEENVLKLSAGLTVAANVSIATGPAPFGGPWSFVLNFSRSDIRF